MTTPTPAQKERAALEEHLYAVVETIRKCPHPRPHCLACLGDVASVMWAADAYVVAAILEMTAPISTRNASGGKHESIH